MTNDEIDPAFVPLAVTLDRIREMTRSFIEDDRRRLSVALRDGTVSIRILDEHGKLGELVEGLDYSVDYAAGVVEMLNRREIRGALSIHARSGPPPVIAAPGRRVAQWKSERRGRRS